MQTPIQRCYDSHTHLLATGQMHSMLQLKSLQTPQNFSGILLQDEFFRGDWLIGFGWDQHQFPRQEFPTRQQLDSRFPDTPVAFSRIDGHALWVNTKALQLCGLLRPVSTWNLPAGGEAHIDSDGMPSGILIDRAMELVNSKIPPDHFALKKSFLRQACQVFNRAGFTHLRDMSGDEEQYQALCELDSEQQLTLYIDQNFSFEKPEDFDSALNLSLRAKKERFPHLRSRGVKFYLDGALGSEGAAISRPYGGSGTNSGFLLWEPEQISEWLRRSWEADVEVSVHTIGDRAAELVVTEACKIWQQNPRGFLNIEHAEVIRTETLQQLRGKPVRLHVQPCHWLSDRKWLQQKLGPLAESAFQWRKAVDLDLALSWGSDSPIERPSLSDNYRALVESVSQIPAYQGPWWKPHEHPDSHWGPECFTILQGVEVAEVIFDGRRLISFI